MLVRRRNCPSAVRRCSSGSSAPVGVAAVGHRAELVHRRTAGRRVRVAVWRNSTGDPMRTRTRSATHREQRRQQHEGTCGSRDVEHALRHVAAVCAHSGTVPRTEPVDGRAQRVVERRRARRRGTARCSRLESACEWLHVADPRLHVLDARSDAPRIVLELGRSASSRSVRVPNARFTGSGDVTRRAMASAITSVTVST